MCVCVTAPFQGAPASAIIHTYTHTVCVRVAQWHLYTNVVTMFAAVVPKPRIIIKAHSRKSQTFGMNTQDVHRESVGSG